MSFKTEFEYLIIGAGPAGLQLGYYLEKSGLNYQILEAGETVGTFFKDFPRHRQLISINKVYTGYEDTEVNLRWDWNSLLSDNKELLFKNYSKKYFPPADQLVKYLNDFAECFNLKIKYGTKIVKITKEDKFNVWDTQGNVYSGKRLVIATGVSKPFIPEIPGIELTQNYTKVSVDPEDFINQKVLIIGKGNSAFETADNLVETTALIHLVSPTSIQMAWKTHYVGHLRAVNNNILDTYQLKSQNAILDATVEKIESRNGKLAVLVNYAHANGETEELIYDRIINCAGFCFDASIFDSSCRPELTINNRFPSQTHEWESTNIKGLYFVGTLMQMRDYKKAANGFIHGFRYSARCLYHIFLRKYHDRELPSQKIGQTPENITNAVITRINKSSALWQQYGYICDLILISEEESHATYYEEVPVDYIHESDLGKHNHYYTITLEYGEGHDLEDPFNVNRIERNDVEQAYKSKFLHPVIRRFNDNKLISEHHIIEDLAGEWMEYIHILPLQRYFYQQLHRTNKQQASKKLIVI